MLKYGLPVKILNRWRKKSLEIHDQINITLVIN